MPGQARQLQKLQKKSKTPADRLAEALRANLARRKKQARARAQAASDAPARG